MRIVSWNVNGIRSVMTKGFETFLSLEKPDIICLQEVKANREQVDLELSDYEHHFWNSAEKKGYSGVAIFSKKKPLSVKNGFGVLDNEGRILALEFEDFYLVNVYTPNSKRELTRLDLRYDEWDPGFLKYVKSFKKPVIFCGDLNVAHEEIDIARPDSNKTTKSSPGNAGFTDKERERFSDILKAGYIDSFRYLHPKKVKYSWWSYMMNARAKNIGWRIDYIMVDEKLKNKIIDADIFDQVTGSDHCPVVLDFKD